jgi:DNA-directed RNA polymerase specialized sigma24 family protein
MQQVAEVKPSGSSAISERTFSDLLSPLIEPGFRLALGMLRDPSAAEDAVQEASFTAWRKLARIQDRSRLRAWFLGVVANNCRNARRRKWVSDVQRLRPELAIEEALR